MPTVDSHFERRDASVRAIYDRLLATVKTLGAFEEDPKKTSIHLNRRTAFAGVATRTNAIVLTLKAGKDIKSSRIVKHEHASANRWHLEVRLESPAQIDAELRKWLADAYEMSA